jgi:hypothetical protein
MSQDTYIIPADQPGLTFRTLFNAAGAALASQHKGDSAPSYAVAGMIWVDDVSDPTWVYKQYDGTDWNTIFTVNISTGAVTFPNTARADGSSTYAADAEASDTYVITLSPAPVAYTTGMQILFKANTANTGACTINVNGLGAKTIKKKKDVDLADNDIKAGQLVLLAYDGTNMQMLSPVSN